MPLLATVKVGNGGQLSSSYCGLSCDLNELFSNLHLRAGASCSAGIWRFSDSLHAMPCAVDGAGCSRSMDREAVGVGAAHVSWESAQAIWELPGELNVDDDGEVDNATLPPPACPPVFPGGEAAGSAGAGVVPPAPRLSRSSARRANPRAPKRNN